MNNKDDITIQPPPIEGWPITDYRLEMWNGLPHPNRASELLRWASDLAANEYLKVECLAASQAVQSLVAQLTASKEREHRRVAALEDIARTNQSLADQLAEHKAYIKKLEALKGE